MTISSRPSAAPQNATPAPTRTAIVTSPSECEYDEKIPPQKAQWAFLHALFPGKGLAAERSAGAGQHGDAQGRREAGARAGHRLVEGRHLDLLRVVLRPRLAMARRRGQGGAHTLRLWQPRVAAAGMARGTNAGRPGGPGRRRYAAQLGQRRIHPAGAALADPGARERTAPV